MTLFNSIPLRHASKAERLRRWLVPLVIAILIDIPFEVEEYCWHRGLATAYLIGSWVTYFPVLVIGVFAGRGHLFPDEWTLMSKSTLSWTYSAINIGYHFALV